MLLSRLLTNFSNSDQLAEPISHTMSEDRAILESVFAKNRNAIVDLHILEKKVQNRTSTSEDPTSFEDTSINTKDPGPELSRNTSVELPPIPDVAPPEPSSNKEDNAASLVRRFSKRGVRLGVHMSILDMGAHTAPAELRKKWINASQWSASELGTEPATTPTSKDKPSDHTSATRESTDSVTSIQSQKYAAHSLIRSPAAKTIGKLIHRLSISRTSTAGQPDEKGKGKENDNSTSEGKDKLGPLRKLSLRLQKPPLKTPDYNQEFENGML